MANDSILKAYFLLMITIFILIHFHCCKHTWTTLYVVTAFYFTIFPVATTRNNFCFAHLRYPHDQRAPRYSTSSFFSAFLLTLSPLFPGMLPANGQARRACHSTAGGMRPGAHFLAAKKILRFWKYPIAYIALRGQRSFQACLLGGVGTFFLQLKKLLLRFLLI